MFTLPPFPPKDHVLKDVNQNQRSSQEHTPFAAPRHTQSNLAKFLSPVPYQENEKLTNIQIPDVNPKVLERWTDVARFEWVDAPGKNDYFLHDMCKKYTVQVVPSYDVRYKHNERVFYRSFKYELDCMESDRLEKLYNKVNREESEDRAQLEGYERKRLMEEKAKTITDMGIKSCKHTAPFWWQNDDANATKQMHLMGVEDHPPVKDVSTYQTSYLRWQKEPYLLETKKNKDPCQRRHDMALIGQPFMSDACNWYYKNYPPPKLSFIQKRFV